MEQIGLEGVFKTEAFASGLNKYTSGINQAIGDTTRAAGTIGTVLVGAVTAGVVALAALAAAGVAAGIAFGNWIYKVSDAAGEMAHDMELLSAKTGLSTTALQQWNVVGEIVGITADDISMYFFRMSRSAYAASQGTKASVDAYAQLGVNIYDLHGKLKDTNTLFLESVTALGKIKDPTLQDALAMQIFGRGAQDLMPLIKMGTASLKAFEQESLDVGAVLDEKTTTAFADFEQQTHFIQAGIKGMTQAFASQFLPILSEVNDDILTVLKDLHGGDFGLAADDIAKSLFKIIDSFTKGIPVMVSKFKEWLPKLSRIIRTYLPALILLGTKLIVSIIKGISDSIPTIVTVATDIVKTIGAALIANWPAIQQSGRDLLKALASGLSAGLTAFNIKIPKLGDIVSWIFGKATTLSAKFKAWVDSVNWKQLSDDVATAISKLPWSGVGAGLGSIGQNIWGAIHDAIFGHPVTTMNMNTHQVETNLVGGIDWGALGIALGAAFDNMVIKALHVGLKIGDVFDLAGLRAEWMDIGTQYGKLAGEGMAPTFWSELWKAIAATPAGAGMPVSWEMFVFGPGGWAGFKTWFQNGWQNNVFPIVIGQPTNGDPWGIKKSIEFWEAWIKLSLEVWGPFLTTFWQTYFVDPFNYAITQIEIAWIKFLAWYNSFAAALGLPVVLLPALPTSGTTKTAKEKTATTTVRNQTTYTTPASTAKAGGTKSVTNNVTINNPSAEPASASVEVTMRRMNYLGFDV